MIEIYISNGVIGNYYIYFRFGAITVPSKFYDNITLFTLKLHGENNSDSIQNHLWTANDVTMKDPLKIPQGVFKATCERYLIELPQKL